METERRPGRIGGFTLIELVLIVAMLSVVSFVVIPNFDAYRRIELKTAVKDLEADIRYAQSQSISTRVRHGVAFDTAGERYTVYRGDATTAAPDFLNGRRPLRRRWDRVVLVSADFDGGTTLEFDSMGIPYNAGGDELSAAGIVVFSEGTTMDTVLVQPLTGKVSR